MAKNTDKDYPNDKVVPPQSRVINGPAPEVDPNSYQVGGNWYNKVAGEQHWDRIWRLFGPDKAWVYFVGQITLYVERYQYKNGIEDLQKAKHFLEKLIWLETQEQAKNSNKEE